MVCVDRYFCVIQVGRQANPAFPDICQRTEEGTARQESLLVEMLLFLSARELGLSRQAIVANLLLDLVESGYRVQCLVGLCRLDIPGIEDFSARVRPALSVLAPVFFA